MQYRRLIRQLAGVALRDPRLIPSLIASGWRFRARGWYSRRPFLPLPPADYIEWRLHTAYGDGGAQPQAGELARYIRWTAEMKKQHHP